MRRMLVLALIVPLTLMAMVRIGCAQEKRVPEAAAQRMKDAAPAKATGVPIALVSSKPAGGLTLDEIPYWRDGTLDRYTPSGDYVVVKFAR